jgi:HPt (histidine-containing phosphotransfer) domain-containing protein
MSDPLAAMKLRFLARVGDDAGLLRDPAAAAAEVGLVVHRLAGIAGVFGYAEVSRLAAKLDEQLHESGRWSGHDMAALVDALDLLLMTG